MNTDPSENAFGYSEHYSFLYYSCMFSSQTLICKYLQLSFGDYCTIFRIFAMLVYYISELVSMHFMYTCVSGYAGDAIRLSIDVYLCFGPSVRLFEKLHDKFDQENVQEIKVRCIVESGDKLRENFNQGRNYCPSHLENPTRLAALPLLCTMSACPKSASL